MSNSKFKCVLCNLTFKSEEKLNKHKFSKIHLENINNIKIEPLVNNNENDKITSYDLDPYLNKEDLNKLKNMDIGEGCQITFNNENIIKCDFNFKEEKEEQEPEQEQKENVDIKTPSSLNPNTIINNEKTVEKPNNNFKITHQKTPKQIQILSFLNQNQNHPQIFNKWFQILQKISNQNLKGLIKHVVDDINIKLEIKQKLLTVVKKYKQILVLKKQKGETTFNNNSIGDIINLLVC